MGSVNIPQIKFDKVELKGKLSNGKFLIESGKLGSPKDDFYGDIKGELGLTLLQVQGQVVPQIGAYNISVDLKANTAFQKIYSGDRPNSPRFSDAACGAACGVDASADCLKPAPMLVGSAPLSSRTCVRNRPTRRASTPAAHPNRADTDVATRDR